MPAIVSDSIENVNACSPAPTVVSVVVPVYNVESYLAECLDSILAQTFTDFEIVCVNDGSTDGSLNILRQYAERDRRITVIDQPNGGQSAARNHAVELIAGKYMHFVDSDDWIHPQFLEKTITLAEETGADMVYFYSDRTRKQQKIAVEKIIRHHPVFNVEQQATADSIIFLSYHAACSRIYRTEYYRRNRIFSPLRLINEDLFVGWQSLFYSPMLAVVPEPLYYYRVNRDSTTGQNQNKSGRDLPEIFALLKQQMQHDGIWHGQWKTLWLHGKLDGLRRAYRNIAAPYKKKMLKKIRDGLGEEEWNFLKNNNDLPLAAKDFYFALAGQPLAVIRHAVRTALHGIERWFK